MHIVTFTRSTPDTAAKVEVNATGAVGWGDAATVVNPWDEYSLEETIKLAQANKGKSTVVSIGPEMHNEALKHSLAMGIDEAVRVWSDGVDVSDSLQWSALAAAAVRKLGDVDLVIFGKESIDVGTDQHIYQTARQLGWTMLSYVSSILSLDPTSRQIRVEKMLEQGKQVLNAPLPAVLSVMKGINEPRYPSFIGIRKASKAVIPVWSAEDLGISAPASTVRVAGYRNLPPREIVTEMIEGDSVQAKASRLVDKLLEEKVL